MDKARERGLRVARLITEPNDVDVVRYLARLLNHVTADHDESCDVCAEARKVGAMLREPLDGIGWG